ncbi:MAG: D-alanine--D-alanine ligase [Acidobacteria bacterium OLB17]|nr:MAG: D-alanine--D-alanine ligase [Acidobacteria bacterium OLB17]MCZ2392087.1 D-alanine--D-alanine ligase [Acidobacteriota bacterium]
MKKNLAIIFGGRSGEHEIAIRSARTVIEQAEPANYHIFPVAISPAGEWLSPAESLAMFPEDTVSYFQRIYGEPSDQRHFLTGDASVGGFSIANGGTQPLDCIFPVLHGTYGEDGTIQGLFEMADIPYVGCGVLASSCGMDKVTMKTLFREADLSICEYVWFLRSEWESHPDSVIRSVEAKIGYPCFVKPANLGSSVGITRANDEQGLRESIALAAEYDRKIIVEEGLDVREIECAVLGNEDPGASEVGEYIIRDESKAFLDWAEKYTGTGNNEFVTPAPLSTELSNKIKELAVLAFKAIDGSGLARVDFFLRKDSGALLVNEINTMPGLTDASGYPKMWEASGMPFRSVIDRLVELAVERYDDKKRNRTDR